MSNGLKILIIDDDPLITNTVSIGLHFEGFQTVIARDGKSGLEGFNQQISLVILDLKLPDISGEDLCQRIRSESKVPILVLTVKDDVESEVNLLELGADDYVTKPFKFVELLARIRALLRRCNSYKKEPSLSYLGIEMKLDTREVSYQGKQIGLSAKEFDLLHLFLSNPRTVLPKEAILNQIWQYDFEGDANIVEVYVRHLRRKLGESCPIQTIHGIGYSLRPALKKPAQLS